MLVDTHCHIDLFDDPINVAQSYCTSHTQCVMVTMLPSHYRMALPHLMKFPSVLAAIGMHPLRAKEGSNEVGLFRELSKSVEFIGEIGIDLSPEGKKTKETQIKNLNAIAPKLKDEKFVSVHSLRAYEEVGDILEKNGIDPVCFHYFTGGRAAAESLAKQGHYFSINHRMLTSRHKELVDVLPVKQVLIESDGPFLTKNPVEKTKEVYTALSEVWGIEFFETARIIKANFQTCRTRSHNEIARTS